MLAPSRTNPSLERHFEGARQHLSIAKRFVDDDDPVVAAWAVVHAFYSALHSTRAVLVFKGITVSSHEEARSQMDIRELKSIRHMYRTLKEHSESVRYYLFAGYSTTDLSKLCEISSSVLMHCKKASDHTE